MFIKNLIGVGMGLVLTAGLFSSPSQAVSEALVALYDGGSGWGRTGHLQDLLEKEYEFNKARVLMSATPEEVPALVHEFLSKPGAPGDKRFVWVSGPGAQNENTPCPSEDMPRVRPPVDTLVLAPACYLDMVGLPFGAKHVAVGRSNDRGADDGGAQRSRRGKRGPAVALLALPSDDPKFIESADKLVMKILRPGTFDDLHPYRLLDGLRNGFRENGSDYTPTLDIASWRKTFITSKRSRNEPDIHPSRRHLASAQPMRPLVNVLKLYGAPKNSAGPALRISGDRLVGMFRSDSSGQMAFVRVSGGYYGWVSAYDLGNDLE
jgi:hypothetical protein